MISFTPSSISMAAAFKKHQKKGSMNASYLTGLLSARTASVQRNSHGCNRIGFFYTKRSGIQSDYSKAVEYCQKAVRLVNADSFDNLGFCCESGAGLQRDASMAADLESSPAINRTGVTAKDFEY